MAEKIISDSNLQAELKRIVGALPVDLRDKMGQSASAAADYVQALDLTEDDVVRIQSVAQTAMGWKMAARQTVNTSNPDLTPNRKAWNGNDSSH